MNKMTIKQLLFVVFVAAVICFLLRRPVTYIVDRAKSDETTFAALVLPWQHWAYLLGFDVSYDFPDPQPGNGFDCFLLLVGFFISAVVHIFAAVFAFVCVTCVYDGLARRGD